LFEYDCTDGIVKQTFTKDDVVELRIDLVLAEDGDNGGRQVEPKARPPGDRSSNSKPSIDWMQTRVLLWAVSVCCVVNSS